MKFFLNTSLKFQTLSFLCILLLTFVGQFYFIQHQTEKRNRIGNAIDVARKAQNSNKDIALQMHVILSGDTGPSSEVIRAIQQQEQIHSLLMEGGSVDETSQIIDPLAPIPQISFRNLAKQWEEFRNSAIILLSEEKETIRETLFVNDSTGISETIQELKVNQDFEKARIIVNGQWKAVSASYDKFIHDLYDQKTKSNNYLSSALLLSILLDLLVLSGFFYWFSKQILTPLKQIETNTGNHIHTFGLIQNEVGNVAKQVNEVIEELKDASEFVERIGDGDLRLDYRELDSNYAEGKNKLADALVSMQTKLRTINENDEKRKWVNEGLNTFADILRSSQDIQILGDKIMSALVHYTKSNQGGIYLLNDDNPTDKYLELVSLFAFDYKKYETRKIRLGEGLLGQTFLEKETTHLSKIPDDYIRITSGLGETKPNNLLLVPLKIDQEVYGMIELASLNTYLPHEISFVEKLGESIASTLASVKASEKNNKLLEEFKLTTEAMRSQEEEMRQNMEELQATQEEMGRKENSYVSQIQTLEEKISMAESNLQLIETLKKRELEHVSKIKQLEEELQNRGSHRDNWAPAIEVEKALKLQLEGLKITQEELRRKGISK